MDAKRHAEAPVAAGPQGLRRRRRASDRLRSKDVIYLIALGLIAASLWVAVAADHRSERADRHATRALARVQEGRAAAIAAICAVDSAIGEAGRAVIAKVPPDDPFYRFLEEHGYPAYKVRQRQSELVGEAYVRSISAHVNHELSQLGRRPIPGLVRANGTIDCKVLAKLSLVPNPR